MVIFPVLALEGTVCPARFNGVVKPSVEYCHWYDTPSPQVKPVADKKTLPEEQNVEAVLVIVPPAGVPLQFTASNSSAPISVGATLVSASISVVTVAMAVACPLSGELVCK